MSADLSPTCGRAAAMFSTLTAIASFVDTAPPVKKSVALGFGLELAVAAGVVDAGKVPAPDGAAAGVSGPLLSAIAVAVPPPTKTAPATIAATV
jgi:hypothetical protein